MRRLLFGAAYYHEYQREDRLATDLTLMARAGFTVIRVGESVWSSWEPADGVFELDWLQPVLDGAHEHGISVVLGTPTYAVPPWLRRKYPETTAEPRTGHPLPYGHRQNVDFTHPAFRHLAERVIRRVVSRYADHPAVIGYQLDNEPGLELLHNRGVFARFVDELRAEYGDVDALNEAWGLTYWSHRIRRWSELWPPDGNTTPAYDLSWRRLQARLTSEYIAWQADIVRELAGPGQFVTTCLAMGHPALDAVRLSEPLDIAAVNPYYGMQDLLTKPAPKPPVIGARPQWTPEPGVWSLFLQADTARGIRQAPFLATETNATAIGEPHVNYPAYDGQWRQVGWAFVARGATMLEYWHWHSAHFGHETYWGGILGHSYQPGRCYTELSILGAEFAAAGNLLLDLRPDEDVAILVSPESRWALEFQPPLASPDGSADRRSYDRVVGAFYRAAFDAGLQAGTVTVDQLGDDARAAVGRWPTLIVPALYVASDATLEFLREYAHAGGHLVLGFRTGYADELARPRATVMPGILAEAVGATYLEFTNLAAPVPVSLEQPLGAGADYTATAWADALEAHTATVLARYDHPHLSRYAAVTTNVWGDGQVTYVGTLPGERLGAALGRWLRHRAGLGDPPALPASVTVTSARARDGRRLTFISNWSWDEIQVPAPVTAHGLTSDEPVRAGEPIALGPWDVTVLVSPTNDEI